MFGTENSRTVSILSGLNVANLFFITHPETMNKVCCVCNELVDVRYLNLVKLEFVYTRGSQLKSMHAV